jgi:hypothetical protein
MLPAAPDSSLECMNLFLTAAATDALVVSPGLRRKGPAADAPLMQYYCGMGLRRLSLPTLASTPHHPLTYPQYSIPFLSLIRIHDVQCPHRRPLPPSPIPTPDEMKISSSSIRPPERIFASLRYPPPPSFPSKGKGKGKGKGKVK